MTAGVADLRRHRRWWPRRRWVRRLLVAAVVVVVAAIVYIVLATSALGVRSIRVSGADPQMQAKVDKAIGVANGTPMARVDVDDVARQVLADVPTVRRVTVARSWPATIEVTVVPRVPVVAYRELDTSVWRLVDEQGVVVRTSASVPKGITAVDAPPSPASVTSAAEVVAALPTSVRSTVASVRAPSRDSITLTTKKGQTIVWGSSENTSLKARVLAALLKHKAKVYDVSAPDLPTTRG